MSGAVQQSDFTMPLPDGGSLAARRRVTRLPSGLSWIEEEMEVRGRLSGAFATGPGWILELHRVAAGSVSFLQDGERVPVVSRRFALLYVPFSVTELVLEDAKTSWIYFDMFETALKRLAFAIAEEGAAKGVSAVAITPGFMRTESILDKFGVTESNWREAAEKNAEAKRFGFKDSETPCFVGRAVAALAADPAVRRWSGGVYHSFGLSQEYGFTDLDGRQPNIWPAVTAATGEAKPAAAVQWALVRS